MRLVWPRGIGTGWVWWLSLSLERGPEGSSTVHGLGQEQRKIWDFPPPAQSRLWVLGLPGLSLAGSDEGGGCRHPLSVTASPQTREQHPSGTRSPRPGRPQRFAGRHAEG